MEKVEITKATKKIYSGDIYMQMPQAWVWATLSLLLYCYLPIYLFTWHGR